MRRFLIFLFCAGPFALFVANAQLKVVDRAGHASFFSEAPLENIEAHSKEAKSILDLKTGEIVASVPMKSFQFKKSLMQEHFNEKYVESDKFPEAVFKGKMSKFEQIDLSQNQNYTMEVTGELTIHGVTRPLRTTATLKVNNGTIQGGTTFPVSVKDFDIAIPKLVIKNIAEVVEVKIDFQYKQLNQ
jgi:polyisoprenoid-binding protein YceI